jgi:multidrug efflux system membrane fusion protein
MQQIDSPPGTQDPENSPPAKPPGASPLRPSGLTDSRPADFAKPAGTYAPRQPASGQSGGFLWILILLVVAGGIGFIVWRAKSTKAAALALSKRGDLSVPIVPGKVVEKEVSVYFDGLGTVQAFNMVTVKPRVDGQLIKVAFTEGQDVHTNDLLAQIDPNPFQAALDQAQAKELQDQALLDNAKLDLQRDLALTNIVTLQTLDTQSNLVRQLEAMVRTDQAGIDSCRVQLDYTTIRAPLEGRCGIRLVDQGNIVHATDTSGVVVITQLRPISVVFTLPEQEVGAVSGKLARGPVSVLALDRDNKTVLDTGTLAVIDNQIDTTTGTIRCKATFPNSNLSLWPGQFINPRVLVDKITGLLVPESVIQRGPDGPYVFTVHGEGSNLVAKLTPVTEGLRAGKMEEGWALVSEGLSVGETVVVDGQYRLEDGTKVRVEEGNQPAGSAAAPGRVNQPGAGAATNRPSTNQLPQQAGA